MQYSFSLTTFSPSGKLVQIEYALNAVNGGSTSLGIKATNGVVIATEKKLRSTLIDESTVQKISTLTPNIGVAYSGMGPDSRLLVRKARKSAQVRADQSSFDHKDGHLHCHMTPEKSFQCWTISVIYSRGQIPAHCSSLGCQ